MVSHRSHRRKPQPGLGLRAKATVLSAAAGAAALTAAPAGGDPEGGGAAATSARADRLHAEVDRLYAEAERATEKYNAAAERVERLRRQVERIRDSAARRQAEVNRMRAALGPFANAQYRSGGLGTTLGLLLSGSPREYLERATVMERLGRRQAERVQAFRHAVRTLEQQRAEAGHKLAALRRQRAELRERQQAVQRRLRAAQRLLNRLPPEERAARERVSRSGARGSGDLPAGLPLNPGTSAPSWRAAAAVAAARQAVGSPYAWGRAGPDAFDCSGLTAWAYRQAGVRLPRTSQGQMNAGRRVSPDRMRPGDLVVYRPDASHVGMYVGGGQVVHAPHPGARVRYDPVGMMPVTAVARP